MKTNKWNRKGFTLVELLVVIAIIVALAALATPAILSKRKEMDKTEAISNMKQVYLTLISFEEDKGSFPSNSTAEGDDDLAGFTGEKSNKLLGQLIAGGYIQSEEIFYAKGGNPASTKKADDVISPKTKILAAGECGFAYTLVNGGGGASASGLSLSNNGGLPILSAPVSQGGTEAVFKTEPYNGRGVYLRVDGSARDARLSTQDSKLKLNSGKTLFQTGEGTVWGEGANALTPTVILPE